MVGMRDGNDHNDRNNGDDYCGGFDVDGVDEVDDVADDDDDSPALVPKRTLVAPSGVAKPYLVFAMPHCHMDVSHF